MKVAIFDFDRTLFPKDTIPYLLSQWYKLKYSRTKLMKVYLYLLPAYIKYKLGIGSKLSKENARQLAVRGFNDLFRGMTKEEVENYFILASESIKKILNSSVVEEIVKAKSKNMHTVIISGAYTPLLKNIGNYLEIDTIIGTDLYYTDDGFYDFNKELSVIKGEKKVVMIKDFFKDVEIEWDESYVFTDSIRDVELLKLVGNPVAVNPDQDLKSIAKDLDWKILS